MAKHKWVCPKCGYKLVTAVDPKYMQRPVHNDEPAHHHNRDIKMELQNAE